MLILKWELVSRVDYWAGVKRWHELFEHDDPVARLMAYLGCHHLYESPAGFQMPEGAAAKLKALNGPYAATLIKAWYANLGAYDDTV